VLIQPEEYPQDRISSNVSSERYRKILTEYYELARLPELSEAQSLRIYEILKLASCDGILSFLLNEIDELTYQELGFETCETQEDLEDEVSKVQEMIPDESDKIILSSLVTSRANRYSSPFSGQHYVSPRIEMAFDTTCSQRLNCERAFFQEVGSLCPRCGDVSFWNNRCGKFSCPLGRSRVAFGSLLKEESVSIFTLIFLGLLVTLIFLV
jgi:hypothetical protein